MGRLAKALAFACAMTAGGAGAAEPYPDYYAARRALERGDCQAAVAHLDAFLREHPYVRDKYPEFYLELRLVMGQCSGRITVRGVEGDSDDIDPLPDHPPMAE